MPISEERKSRFISGPGELTVKYLDQQLQEEIDKNLAAMENPSLSNEMFVQLSEKNIELQNRLLKYKQGK